MPYLLFADRVRRGSRALAAVFREAPRGIRDGWRNARSVRPADALTRPLARGGALRLVVRSPLIPFVDPLPLPGGCRHRSMGAGWWLTSARRSASSVASTLLLLRRIVLVLCPGCVREPMPRRHCVGRVGGASARCCAVAVREGLAADLLAEILEFIGRLCGRRTRTHAARSCTRRDRQPVARSSPVASPGNNLARRSQGRDSDRPRRRQSHPQSRRAGASNAWSRHAAGSRSQCNVAGRRGGSDPCSSIIR